MRLRISLDYSTLKIRNPWDSWHLPVRPTPSRPQKFMQFLDGISAINQFNVKE